MSNKMTLPTIDQVKDLPQNPSYPAGFNSAPSGPGATVESLGVKSVVNFALTYNWSTSDQKKAARLWANHTVNACAFAATMREFQGTLTAAQLRSLNLSCNVANDYTNGKNYLPFVKAYTNDDPNTLPITIDGLSFPANFTQGTGFSGETTFELGPENAKAMAFSMLISDVRKGIYQK